jgi:hypothetical protein
MSQTREGYCHIVDSMRDLIFDEKIRRNIDICFVARKLFSVLLFGTRCGIKTILLKGNGEPLKKQHPPEMEIESYPKL